VGLRMRHGIPSSMMRLTAAFWDKGSRPMRKLRVKTSWEGKRRKFITRPEKGKGQSDFSDWPLFEGAHGSLLTKS